ncbi:DUF2306 domain-containing protein [Algoriphagus sp. AGSA1]|uniref:DUF2306 domain-containing protein n=1 Tax=Algoriphagus sp. AGSA1 TaxID=2907213 RepID=UPI001F1B4235|nr:DUF2306 domain-containing protein [Algoriphagus sp. AGSA1]MCE7053463.1 DUF2306 domain-containing protein [Algoriphagus sp. AGSA1]
MSKITNTPALAHPSISQGNKVSSTILRWSGIALVATVWISAALFGLYILAFYASALYEGEMVRWNHVLPNLYEENSVGATAGIGIHFAAGGMLLLLGSIQLIDRVRVNFPSVHRLLGKIYIISSLLTAVGGLTFILIRGTVGGLVMDIGFSLYGVLTGISAIQTYHHAVKGRFVKHRAWALRLYALAIGSWIYRMDYGFWTLLTGGMGRGMNFSGPFDHIMDFFFYVPNLLVAELFIRVNRFKTNSFLQIIASLVLLFATGFILLGTYFITLRSWGPAIINWISAF